MTIIYVTVIMATLITTEKNKFKFSEFETLVDFTLSDSKIRFNLPFMFAAAIGDNRGRCC